MKKVLIVMVPVFLVIFLIISFLKFFRIGKVVCSNQFGNCQSYLVDKLSKAEGKGLLDSFKSVEAILMSDQRIIKFSVRFKLPNELSVDLIERKAIIAWDQENGKLKLYDRSGFLVGEATSSQLPRVSGNIDPKNLNFVILTFSDINTFYNSREAKIEGDHMIVHGIEGKTVIFPLQGSRDYLFGALNLILSRLPKGYEISTIDLRFKNPVLR